ncbi:hypothetical protein [Pseudomarimonas salicorniae]|uniref:Uncharacterized protein n=1 Tax=Pseudomarimonas salicorniae TaxID=2933270 RepID=A0ABT0GG86_9GAMM|nr:hypothetical protein [Lysobacter sp. CAU 1642]MCK7593067.1 hypothetical protein [Lysobacter sp. CAU 1642]
MLFLLVAAPASSQVGLRQGSIDAGSGRFQSESYRIRATLGQYEAGLLTGGRFRLLGGTASFAQPAPSGPLVFRDSFEDMP